MGPSAELGPLDVQIEHPDREGVSVSGLDVANAIEFLAGFGVDYAIAGGAAVLKWTELPRSEVLREFLRYVAYFLEPVIEKLDPNLVHRAKQQLRVAQDYARRMLSERELGGERLDAAGLRKLTTSLVQEYPAHGFVISRREAASLGLPVKPLERYEAWPSIKRRYEAFAGRLRYSMMSGEQAESVIDWAPDHLSGEGRENGKETDGQENGNQSRNTPHGPSQEGLGSAD